ncbi:unnamed protein product, partial [Protopolystoma xenopodis]
FQDSLFQGTLNVSVNEREKFEFNNDFTFDESSPNITAKPIENNEFQHTSNNSLLLVDKLISKYRANLIGLNEASNSDLNFEEYLPADEAGDNIKEKFVKFKSKYQDQEVDEKFKFMQSVSAYKDLSSFMHFCLAKPILKSLTDMSLDKPTPIQCACIPLCLLNKDVCACARTGSGKTVAFLLPIIERLIAKPSLGRSSTRALILSPTRELAVQIFTVTGQLLKYCPKIKVQLAAGGLDRNSQETSLRGNPDIVIATPGRLIDHISNAPNFSLSTVEYLVLDEADKLLDEYFTEQIAEIIRHCSRQRQTMLFSATMTESVRLFVTLVLISYIIVICTCIYTIVIVHTLSFKMQC